MKYAHCDHRTAAPGAGLLRWSMVFAAAFAATLACPPTSVAEQSAAPTKYMLIVTGSELLNGIYADSHTFFITRTLRPLGLQCVGSMSVDDRESDILAALEFAHARAQLIIVTGGLGPTTDSDVTRGALSDFTKIPLREDPKVLSAMSRRFNVKPEDLRSNLRRQCMTPERGSWLPNAGGTAVGLVFELGTSVVVALPGPPGELRPMVTDHLVPYLHKRFASHLPGCALTVHFVGVGQSGLDQQLKDRIGIDKDIVVTSQFEGGRVDFTFTTPADTPGNRKRLERLKAKIAANMGPYIYGYDKTTLEDCVLDVLRDRHATLVLVESGSGGALTASLSRSPADADVLAAAYVAPTQKRLAVMLGSATDKSTVEQLAEKVAASTPARWVIVTGQSTQADSSPVSVKVAIRPPGGPTRVLTMQTKGSGEMVRERLSTQLLDALRKQLISTESR